MSGLPPRVYLLRTLALNSPRFGMNYIHLRKVRYLLRNMLPRLQLCVLCWQPLALGSQTWRRRKCCSQVCHPILMRSSYRRLFRQNRCHFNVLLMLSSSVRPDSYGLFRKLLCMPIWLKVILRTHRRLQSVVVIRRRVVVGVVFGREFSARSAIDWGTLLTNVINRFHRDFDGPSAAVQASSADRPLRASRPSHIFGVSLPSGPSASQRESGDGVWGPFAQRMRFTPFGQNQPPNWTSAGCFGRPVHGTYAGPNHVLDGHLPRPGPCRPHMGAPHPGLSRPFAYYNGLGAGNLNVNLIGLVLGI